MKDTRLYALDQFGKKIFKGDTVFRQVKNKPWNDVHYPPDRMFFVVTDVQPDYAPLQGHHYKRREMPEGGQCAYISIDGPMGDYPRSGAWYADDFVFSCRSEE